MNKAEIIARWILCIVLIAVIIGLVAIFLVWLWVPEAFETTKYGGLSDEELAELPTDWNYRDLERNFDRNNGNLIVVQGKITNIQPDVNSITLCEQSVSESSCDIIFIKIVSNSTCSKTVYTGMVTKYNPSGAEEGVYDCANIVKGDKVAGYVEIDGVSESSSGDVIPTVKNIILHCSTC